MTESVSVNQTLSTMIWPNPKFSEFLIIYIGASIGTIGLIVNGFTLLVIICQTVIWKKINFFLLVNQIAIDFVTCLFIALQYFSIFGGDPTITSFGLRTTNQLLCQWWYSFVPMWSFIHSSTSNLVVMTFERYIKIIHPLTYRAHLTKV